MTDVFYSKSNKSFYPLSMKDDYENGLGWPSDAVKIGFDIWKEFTGEPPTGKKIGNDENGMPKWIDVDSAGLLERELVSISELYKKDINDLNNAYLAAIVSDGPGEPVKQQAVRDAITARKAQYAADKEAARLKYPV